MIVNEKIENAQVRKLCPGAFKTYVFVNNVYGQLQAAFIEVILIAIWSYTCNALGNFR